jgi:hypothetical protein
MTTETLTGRELDAAVKVHIMAYATFKKSSLRNLW